MLTTPNSNQHPTGQSAGISPLNLPYDTQAHLAERLDCLAKGFRTLADLRKKIFSDDYHETLKAIEALSKLMDQLSKPMQRSHPQFKALIHGDAASIALEIQIAAERGMRETRQRVLDYKTRVTTTLGYDLGEGRESERVPEFRRSSHRNRYFEDMVSAIAPSRDSQNPYGDTLHNVSREGENVRGFLEEELTSFQREAIELFRNAAEGLHLVAIEAIQDAEAMKRQGHPIDFIGLRALLQEIVDWNQEGLPRAMDAYDDRERVRTRMEDARAINENMRRLEYLKEEWFLSMADKVEVFRRALSSDSTPKT